MRRVLVRDGCNAQARKVGDTEFGFSFEAPGRLHLVQAIDCRGAQRTSGIGVKQPIHVAMKES